MNMKRFEQLQIMEQQIKQKNEVIKNKINRQEQLYQLTIEAQLEKTGEEVYF